MSNRIQINWKLLTELLGVPTWISSRKELRAWTEMNENIKVKRCPKCGSPKIEATCMGILRGPDTNRAMCHGPGCDWTGIAEECKGPKHG